MKDLLFHCVYRPSRNLLQTLCVPNRFLHLLVFSEKSKYEGVISSRRLAGQILLVSGMEHSEDTELR